MTPHADLVIRNAVIHTVDEARPRASSIAVAEGRILAIGDDADVASVIGPDTVVHDLQGRAVVPGLIDAHNHHSLAGRAALFECQFPDTASVAEIIEAVRGWIETHPDDEWVIGGNWGSGLFEELAQPAALAALDAASGSARVLLSDDSHHNKWANSAAMAAAGIGPDTPDPVGGQIMRAPSGAPTGVLLEAAGVLVEQTRSATSAPDTAYWASCSAHAIVTMNERGITAFMDASGSELLMDGLALLDSRGDLTAWAVSAMLVNDFIFGTELLGEELFTLREKSRTRHHRPDFAKIFLDGVPPARTAAFLEPYRADPEHGHDFHGGTTMSPDQLLDWFRIAGSQGLGVKVHCTGDRSVRFVLDAVETVRGEGIDVIFHVAHGQFIAEEDIPRFAELGVVAEISPALWFPGVIVDAILAVRPDSEGWRIHPNRLLLDAGATVACGSDWPVAPDPNPWTAMSGLVTRADPSGTVAGTVWPEQAITAREALTAYTMGGARALGLADEIGSLTPGKSADFVVLNTDPLECEPAALASIYTLETWFEGRRVYASAERHGASA